MNEVSQASDATAPRAASGEGIRYGAATPPYDEPFEVVPGIFWLRLRLPLRLNHVNVWLIEEEDGWTVIDTGFDTPETRAVWEAVQKGPMAGRPLRRLLVTHYHPDHCGLAGHLCARTGAECWTTRTEWLTARLLALDTSEGFNAAYEAYDRAAGLPEAFVRQRRQAGNTYRKRAGPPPPSYRRVVAGEEIVLGGRRFSVIVGEGHAPEMITLLSAEGDLLIAADQILPRISPVVAVAPSAPDADPLTEFLDSLVRYEGIGPDCLVLPSHGRPFFGLPARIAELRHHHEERLERALAACREPATAFEIMPALFDIEIVPGQLGFALGETYAHMNHLLRRGQVERWRGEDGAWRYRAR